MLKQISKDEAIRVLQLEAAWLHQRGRRQAALKLIDKAEAVRKASRKTYTVELIGKEGQ